MARDRVFEGRAEVRSLSVVAGEPRVRLGDVRAWTRLRGRPPILLWHRKDLERGLRPLTAAHGHLEDLGLAACGGELQIAFGAVDLPEEVRAARAPAAVVDRECRSALQQSADGDLIVRGPRLAFPRAHNPGGLSGHRRGGRDPSDRPAAPT